MNTLILQDILQSISARNEHKGTIRVILKSGYAVEVLASDSEWTVSSRQNIMMTSDDVHIDCAEIAAVYWCEKPYGTDGRLLPRGR